MSHHTWGLPPVTPVPECAHHPFLGGAQQDNRSCCLFSQGLQRLGHSGLNSPTSITGWKGTAVGGGQWPGLWDLMKAHPLEWLLYCSPVGPSCPGGPVHIFIRSPAPGWMSVTSVAFLPVFLVLAFICRNQRAFPRKKNGAHGCVRVSKVMIRALLKQRSP